ncbi:MAG: peptide deformylase [Gemmatales bacterium]|nr:MAG: peptide deformylase [Gemmatales bacterium]
MSNALKIVKYPHPALRHKAKPLSVIDKEVRIQAEKMLELMYEANGLGLAANQVALPFQLIVLNPTADPNQREHERVCINPTIIERKGSVEGEEGCLSFPKLFQKIRRARSVVVRAYDLKGEEVEISALDLEARLFQHEIDHLHGILFIDKMGTIARLASRGILKDLEKQYYRAQERGDIPPNAEIEEALVALEARA